MNSSMESACILSRVWFGIEFAAKNTFGSNAQSFAILPCDVKKLSLHPTEIGGKEMLTVVKVDAGRGHSAQSPGIPDNDIGRAENIYTIVRRYLNAIRIAMSPSRRQAWKNSDLFFPTWQAGNHFFSRVISRFLFGGSQSASYVDRWQGCHGSHRDHNYDAETNDAEISVISYTCFSSSQHNLNPILEGFTVDCFERNGKDAQKIET